MAEAFAKMYGGHWLEAHSAGCRPAAPVHAKAIAAMQEIGYDLRQHFPKGLADIPDIEYDVAVVMCDDECVGVRAKRRERWPIPVPKEMAADQFRTVRDQIAAHVKELLNRLRPTNSAENDPTCVVPTDTEVLAALAPNHFEEDHHEYVPSSGHRGRGWPFHSVGNAARPAGGP
jgi:arsenate reductase